MFTSSLMAKVEIYIADKPKSSGNLTITKGRKRKFFIEEDAKKIVKSLADYFRLLYEWA